MKLKGRHLSTLKMSRMTHSTTQSDNVFTSLRRELDVGVGVECSEQQKRKDLVTT